ncbi:MAG: amidase [Anaerolineales bacterium]|nr:amidase [Anaerolineales bacterium]
MELTSLTISEAAELISSRQLSPVDLTQAHLERIDQLDPSLNSYLTITTEAALERAEWAERELLREERHGTLFGIPLAFKDLYETRGVRTTAGSKIFTDYVPEKDAYTVQKLNAAGAIILGKLNMHEIALGVTNVNPHFGPCRNPWSLDRVSGGSSGGSGVALAAGLCLGSLGSDTGGSIRIPASLCGVVGLKGTYGRVSLRGVIPLSWHLDHAGPMARRVRDVAILMQVIAGYDADDPASIDHIVDDYLDHLRGGVRGWRVALASGEFFDKTDAEVNKAVHEAAKVFESLGAEIIEAELPQARQAAKENGLMTNSDAAAFHYDRLQNYPEDFGEDIRQRLVTGAAYTSTDYIQARRTQTVLRRKFEMFFDEYDLLLTPTTPVPAPPIEGPDAVEQARLLTRFTAPFNLTGLPALSLPCGFTSNGLPVGLQIIARPWAEAHILRAGNAYETATEWHLMKPAFNEVNR